MFTLRVLLASVRRSPKRRAARGAAAAARGAGGSARAGVDAAVLARMTVKQLEELARRLRAEGDEGVPGSRPWDVQQQKRVRLDPDAYRAALAARKNKSARFD